jgi:hypothetical protein
MAKNSETTSYSSTSIDSKFDIRLIEKKIEHGFLTRQERDQHLKNLPEEKEYEFTSAEALDAETTPSDS